MRALLLALLLLAPMPGTLLASSLRVMPATVEVAAPGSVAALTLRNEGSRPAHYQIRLFRWVQQGGGEQLLPTSDVVVSPPMTRIAPGVDYTVRIVRLNRQPVMGEESYRVLVDELPAPEQRSSRTVNFLIRYSIPVFFTPPAAHVRPLAWRASLGHGGLTLAAANPGERRVKVTDLKLRDRSGRVFALKDGLAGYVLPGAGRQWTFPAESVPGIAPGEVRLLFQTDVDSADVPVILPGRG